MMFSVKVTPEMHCRNRADRSLPRCLCFLYGYHKGPQRYSSCSLHPLDKRSVTLHFPFPLADTAILHLKASHLKIHAWWRQGCRRIKFRSGSDSRYTNNKTRLRSIHCSLPPATHLHSSWKYLQKPPCIRFSDIIVYPLNYIHSTCCQKGSFWFCLLLYYTEFHGILSWSKTYFSFCSCYCFEHSHTSSYS